MIEFTNLETHPGSTGLSQTEIDVLLSVQKHYLAETVGGELSLGTCIGAKNDQGSLSLRPTVPPKGSCAVTSG